MKPYVFVITLLASSAVLAQFKASCSVECDDGTSCSTGTNAMMKTKIQQGSTIRYTLDEGLGKATYEFAFKKGENVDYDRVRDYVMLNYFQPELAGKVGENNNLLKGDNEQGDLVRCWCDPLADRQAKCVP